MLKWGLMYSKELFDKSEVQFKRLTGVKKQTFKIMLKILEVQHAVDHEHGGKPLKVSLENRLLMALEYWREYRTYYHIGNTYGYSESQAFKIIKWVENTLIKSKVFNIPGKKNLHGLDKEAIVLIDVTESPIERPKKKTEELLFRKEKKTYNKNPSDSK
jgi:hypothetical protein